MPDATRGTATAYRITSITIVDPKLWQASGSTCSDITEYFNAAVGSQVTSGAIDALIVFEPLSTTSATPAPAELLFGECDSTQLNCSVSATSVRTDLTAMSMVSGTCLDVVSGTVATDPPPTVSRPTAPCSRASGQTGVLDLAGLRLDLVDFRIGAAFSAEAVPANLTKGLLYGYLTKTEAATVFVPGFNQTLDVFFRGGGSCADNQVSDLDTAPAGSGPGWYIYLAFTATKVSFVDNR